MAMGRSEKAIITLEEAKGRFEEWRSNRRGKARIPAELWSAAVEVARKEGINRTARELHVAWDDLKRRVTTAQEVRLQPGSAAFVELIAPQTRSVPECILEVEGRRGKLRIQLKGAVASDLAVLSRACGFVQKSLNMSGSSTITEPRHSWRIIFQTSVWKLLSSPISQRRAGRGKFASFPAGTLSVA
jgi:hypothetical protein